MGYSKEYIKQRTIEIYDSLPQDRELRIKCLKERDEIINLNYTFFGYIASKTFINNSSISYEDKFQSAVMHFCECWWWYHWDGDEHHKGYRRDLAFGVFFKPRIAEMIERELNEVKYSIRRSICMEIGAQLNKHWGQVKYEDISKVKLSPEKVVTAKAIFGTLYQADLESHEMFLEGSVAIDSPFDNPTEKYESIVDLLIHDMIAYEEKLDDAKLLKMSEIYGIPFDKLKAELPKAEEQLYKQLSERIEM